MSGPLPQATGPVHQASNRLDVDALRRALANLTAEGEVALSRWGTPHHFYGYTPLHIVVDRSDNAEMVSMLLKAGHDVNARTNTDGPTALHIAVSHGRVDCVAALLAAGASVTIKYDGLEPIDEVTNDNCRRIVPMLLRAGSEGVYLDQQRPGTSDPRFWFHDWDGRPYHEENYRILSNYFMKIFMSNSGSKIYLSGPAGPGPGTFATYEKAHRARLTKTFVPKFPQLPAEIVPTIVAYAFHTGWY